MMKQKNLTQDKGVKPANIDENNRDPVTGVTLEKSYR